MKDNSELQGLRFSQQCNERLQFSECDTELLDEVSAMFQIMHHLHLQQ